MKIGISTPAEQNKIDSSLVASLMTCAKTHVLDQNVQNFITTIKNPFKQKLDLEKRFKQNGGFIEKLLDPKLAELLLESNVTKNPKSTFFIFQAISMAVQRGNVQCVQGAYGEPAFEELDKIFYVVKPNDKKSSKQSLVGQN